MLCSYSCCLLSQKVCHIILPGVSSRGDTQILSVLGSMDAFKVSQDKKWSLNLK